jgi:hypothetical protein
MNKKEFLDLVKQASVRLGFTYDVDSARKFKAGGFSIFINVYRLYKSNRSTGWALGACYTEKEALELKASMEKNLILTDGYTIEITKDRDLLTEYELSKLSL